MIEMDRVIERLVEDVNWRNLGLVTPEDIEAHRQEIAKIIKDNYYYDGSGISEDQSKEIDEVVSKLMYFNLWLIPDKWAEKIILNSPNNLTSPHMIEELRNGTVIIPIKGGDFYLKRDGRWIHCDDVQDFLNGTYTEQTYSMPDLYWEINDACICAPGILSEMV